MKSRIGILLTQALTLLSIISYVICLILRPDTIVFVLIGIVMIAGNVASILLSRCPHCHRIGGLRRIPIKKTAEQCHHCGKTVEYQ